MGTTGDKHSLKEKKEDSACANIHVTVKGQGGLFSLSTINSFSGSMRLSADRRHGEAQVDIMHSLIDWRFEIPCHGEGNVEGDKVHQTVGTIQAFSGQERES